MAITLNGTGSGFNRAVINDNFQKIEDELNNNVLRRDGVLGNEDNAMREDLDMNSQRILNLPKPENAFEPARLIDLDSIVGGINLTPNAAEVEFNGIVDYAANNVEDALEKEAELRIALENRVTFTEDNLVANNVQLGNLSSDVTVLQNEMTVVQNRSLGNLVDISSLSSSKANRDQDAVADNIAVFDANGNPVDSGATVQDIIDGVASGGRGPLFITAEQFGAVGGGVVDDTAAIQAAIDFADENVVILLTNKQYLSGPLYIEGGKKNFKFGSLVKSKITLKDSVGVRQPPLLNVGNYSLEAPYNVEVFGLELDGNKDNQFAPDSSGTVANCLVVNNFSNLKIKEVTAHNSIGYGILFAGTNLPGRENALVIECETYNNEYDGFDIKGGGSDYSISGVKVVRCKSHNNNPSSNPGTGVGFDIRGTDTYLLHCESWENALYGYRSRAENPGESNRDSHVFDSCIGRDNLVSQARVDSVTGSEKTSRFSKCEFQGGNYGFQVDSDGITYIDESYIHDTAIDGMSLNSNGVGVVNIDLTNITRCRDGILALSGLSSLSITNSKINDNERNGVISSSDSLSIKNTRSYNNSQNNSAGRGLAIVSALLLNIKDSSFSDYQGTPTQQAGVRFEIGASEAEGVFADNNIFGNTSGQISGAIPSNLTVLRTTNVSA